MATLTITVSVTASASATAAKTSDAKTGDKKEETKKTYSGMHSFMVYDRKFTVDAKYQPLKPIGRGAYGVVCSALDRSTGRKVAIKKIPNAFEDLIDAKRILREIKLLRHFAHENVIKLYDMICPPENDPFEDVYMVFELMDTDMSRIINSKNELTDEHFQYFVYQMLCGLKYIHSANVIHRDLKPSNLLLNSDCKLKVCDFGLARGVKKEVDYELTEYVVTRWYRAPEVMCACHEYDHKLDVWSVGCILAELMGRKPLFPGKDYIDQMNLIFAVLGTPNDEDMKSITNDKARDYIRSLKKQKKVPFNRLFPKVNPLALDLLEKMLEFNPHKRTGVADALKHPYLARLHHPPSETECKSPFDFEFEKVDMTKHVLKEFIWEEIIAFRPEARPKRDRWQAREQARQQKTGSGRTTTTVAAGPAAATASTTATASTAAPTAAHH